MSGARMTNANAPKWIAYRYIETDFVGSAAAATNAECEHSKWSEVHSK